MAVWSLKFVLIFIKETFILSYVRNYLTALMDMGSWICLMLSKPAALDILVSELDS